MQGAPQKIVFLNRTHRNDHIFIDTGTIFLITLKVILFQCFSKRVFERVAQWRTVRCHQRTCATKLLIRNELSIDLLHKCAAKCYTPKVSVWGKMNRPD